MGFRFFRRVRVAPGMTLNFSKGGLSTSFGPRGAKYTVGTSGTRGTVGLPGTGLYYTQHSGTRKRGSRAAGKQAPPPPDPVTAEQRLTLGFFQRLFVPRNEQAFVNGVKAFVEGNEKKSVRLLAGAPRLADATFLAGFLALKQGKFSQAAQLLLKTLHQADGLGVLFQKYGVMPNLGMRITDELVAHIGPTRRGVLLGLVEVYQETGDFKQAIKALRQLRQSLPDDVVVKVSLAELLLESAPESKQHCKYIVRMTHDVKNESPAHAALLLYKARALRTLELYDAARDTLTAALRRKKDRSDDLLYAIRCERAEVYEAMGHQGRARSEYEKLYAQNPSDAVVSRKLGLAE